MRRGLTMIELLVALSLLSIVMVAVATWTQVTARAAQSAAGPMRWRAAAETLLTLIHDDLVSGDLGDARRPGGRGQARVEAIDGTLRIETRAVGPDRLCGPVAHRYVLDAISGELRLERRIPQGTRTSHLLLDSVREWQGAIDQEEVLLSVSITAKDGTTVARSYLLP
jgi:prepilin-type N-terminal cleavage/methylation domain-containing protein